MLLSLKMDGTEILPKMYLVGKVADHAKRLVEVTQECMFAGIKRSDQVRTLVMWGLQFRSMRNQSLFGS